MEVSVEASGGRAWHWLDRAQTGGYGATPCKCAVRWLPFSLWGAVGHTLTNDSAAGYTPSAIPTCTRLSHDKVEAAPKVQPFGRVCQNAHDICDGGKG